MATQTATKDTYEVRKALNTLAQYARGVETPKEALEEAAKVADTVAGELYAMPDGEEQTYKIVS